MRTILQGFWAGVIAGLIKNGLDFAVYHGLHLHRYRYLDLIAGVHFGRTTQGIAEISFALFIDIWFSAMLGIVFFLIAAKVKGHSNIILGLIYGSALWFIIHSGGAVLKVPTFDDMMLSTLFLHFITDSVYGMALGYFYQRWVIV